MANLITENPVQGFTGDVVATTHAPASVVYNAVPGLIHQFYGAEWCYAGSSTVGATAGMTVLDGTNIIYKVGIAAAGFGQVALPRPKNCTAGAAMTVTLADGGASLVGTLTVDHDQTFASWFVPTPTITGFDLTGAVSNNLNWPLWFPLMAW